MATASQAHDEAPTAKTKKPLKFQTTKAPAQQDDSINPAAIKAALAQMSKTQPVPPWLMQGVAGGPLQASPSSMSNAMTWIKNNGG